MEKIYIQYYKSPIGELVLGSFKNKLCLCDWRYRKMRESINKRLKNALNADFEEFESEIHTKTIQQLQEYFLQQRTNFDLPIHLVGTDFQKKVWELLQEIPFGKTSSYLELSQKMGNENAIRAVASANGANAFAIIIPCHRVIGSNFKLVGYAGGLKAKKYLIDLENMEKQLALF